MNLIFPIKNVWKQINRGELFGSIWASWNLDLISNFGKIKVSPRTIKITSSSDVATVIRPTAFIRTKARAVDEWWALCDQKMIRTNGVVDPTTAWIADATANSPTSNLSSLYSDMVEFNGDLYVSLFTDISQLSAGTWTASWWVATKSQSALTGSTIPHPLSVSFNNLLCIGDGKKMHTVDTSGNVKIGAVTLPSYYQIRWIRTTNSAVWIGAKHLFGGQGKVFRWDGSSLNFNQDYKIGGAIDTYSCVIKDEIPWIMTSNGELMYYRGGIFVRADNLPVLFNKFRSWITNTAYDPLNKNGMTLVDNRINMLIDAGVGGGALLENSLSGIWEYTPETGLSHKYSIDNLYGAASNFGSPQIQFAGALVATQRSYGSFLFGAEVAQDAVPTLIDYIGGLDTTDTTLKVGYFITPKIFGRGIEESWQRIYGQFAQFLNATDQLIIKYRVDKKVYSGVNGLTTVGKTGTWSSSTTFTVNNSQTFSDVSIGDEIEIIQGPGAGMSAVITNITGPVASVWTVTIDQTITNASEAFFFKVNNWVTMNAFANQVERWHIFQIIKNSSFVQFKVIMFAKGDSPELEKLLLKSETKFLL